MREQLRTTKWVIFGFFAAMLFIRPATVGAATLLGDFLKEKNVEISVSAAMDYYDKYVWRGMLLDKDPVYQPGVSVAIGGFAAGFWGSFDTKNDDALTSEEVDGWVGYNFDLGFVGDSWEKVDASVGHTWYAFPDYDTNSLEYSFGLSVDTFLSPYIKYYLDYEDESKGGADGQYLMLGIGHGFTLNKKYGVVLALGQEISFNDEAFINGEGGYFLTTASLSAPIIEGVTASLKAGYSSPFDDLEESYKEEVYTGISLAFEF